MMNDTTIDLPPVTTAIARPHEPPPPCDLLCTIATTTRPAPLNHHHRHTCSEKTYYLRNPEKTQCNTTKTNVKQNKTQTLLKTTFWVKTKIHLNSPTQSRLAILNEFTPSLPSLLKNQVNSVRVCVNSNESTG